MSLLVIKVKPSTTNYMIVMRILRVAVAIIVVMGITLGIMIYNNSGKTEVINHTKVKGKPFDDISKAKPFDDIYNPKAINFEDILNLD
jgi:hypothetical protein